MKSYIAICSGIFLTSAHVFAQSAPQQPTPPPPDSTSIDAPVSAPPPQAGGSSPAQASASAPSVSSTSSTPSTPSTPTARGEAATDVRDTQEVNQRRVAGATSEVTVTASRSTRDVFDTPVGINIVRREQIARTPATTTADLVRDQPGIWTNGEGLRNTTPILRGLTGNQVSLMIDGVRMNTGILFGGPNSFMQDLDPENIDRIEIVRGAGSVMWGTDALGGTVHIFTRPPPNWAEPGGVRFAGRLSATLGSFNQSQRYRAEAGAATENFRLRVGYTNQSVGDIQSPGVLGVQSPSGWRSRSLDLRADARVGRNVVTLELQDQQNDDVLNYDISLNRPEVGDGVRRLGLLRIRSTPGLSWLQNFEAQAYVQQQSSTTRRLDNGVESRREVVTGAFDVQARTVLAARQSLTYGAHFHVDAGTSENAAGAGARSRGFPDSKWWNGAVFVAGDLRPIQWITVLPAVRLDVFHLSSAPDPISVPNGLTANELTLSQTNVAPTGSLGVVGYLTRWLNVVASGGRGFRAANVSDQVSSGPFRNGYNVPSPGLLPESSWTVEGGVRVRERGLLSGSATFFYTRVDGLITQVRRNPDNMANDCVDVNNNMRCDANEYVFLKQNIGRASMMGVELDATVELPRNFQINVVGTWMTGRDEVSNLPLDRIIPMNATLSARYQPGRFYVDLSARFVAPMQASEIACDRIASDGGFHLDPRDVNSPLLGTLQRTTVMGGPATCSGAFPGYVTMGLRAGVFITSFIEFRASVTNLTNQNYRDKEARFDAAGIGAFATLTVREPE